MAASDHLHPTLFHGSRQQFKPGDTIQPVTEATYKERGYSTWEEDEGEGAEEGDYAALSHTKGYKVIRKVK